MGELVAGVGDEVLLFATFLILSACMYVSVLLYRSHGNRQNTEQPAPQANESESSRSEATNEATIPPSSQPEIQPSTQSTLRSRFNPIGTTSERLESSDQISTADPPSDSETSTAYEEPSGDNLISIRLIFSNESRTVRLAPNTTLHELRSSHFRAEVAQNRPVRFIFQGRVLPEDNATLVNLGIIDGRAVHVHIGRPRSPGEVPTDGPDTDQDLDLSRLFVPLFGIILGLVWVSMLMYPGVFNITTKIFLFLLSLGYVMLTYVTTFS